MRLLTRWRQRRPILTLALMTVVLAVVFESLPPHVEDIVDLALTLTMAAALAWVVIDFVRHTEVWTTRRLGLAGVLGGDALLYLALAVGSFIGWRSHLLDLTRACLVVGVVHLLIGMYETRERKEPA